MVTLKAVREDNVWPLLRLKVAENQRDFVATNTESIVEAYCALAAGETAMPYGIYDGETPVGFLMLGYGKMPGDAEKKDAPPAYSLWRFMIDERYQRKGLGREALKQALALIRTKPCGPADVCFLSYEPENTTAKELYLSFGFRENGMMDEEEIIAVLRL